MGTGMQIIPATRQVLMVAPPADPQVSELITALRTAGVNVLFADTIAVAARADEFVLCIVILRPGQWRTVPTIMTVMHSNPRYLIPVLAEPMPLPAGAWSTEAILIKEPLSNTVHELKTLIENQLHPSAQDTSNDQKQPINSNVYKQNIASTLPALNYKKVSRRLHYTSRYAITGVLIIVLAVLLYYAVGQQHSVSGLDKNTQAGGSNIGVSAFKQSNVVSVPGPGCNTNSRDWWSVGNYFKVVNTPTATASNGSPSPQVSPTPHVVNDNSIVATCQSHGLYVQHTDHYDGFAEVFFGDNAQGALPQHFSTQVTAAALNPSSSATFVLGVRHQRGEAYNYDRGYGDDVLEVGVDGRWRTVRINDVTDQDDAIFTRGYVKPARTMTLGAEVDGPRITFVINGQKLTTIVDQTYPSGYSIGFGLSDGSAKSPPSASYSDFSYQPLADTKLTAQSMVATATAQANKNLHAVYTAAIPGAGCDKGSGQWQPMTKERNHGTARCQSNGLAISQSANVLYNSYAPFYGLDGNLPTNYSVKVQIDTSQLGSGCAGLRTRTDTQAAGYAFFVCSNGYWDIQRYNSHGGKGYRLADGYVDAQTSYTMIATANKDVQSLSLNGVTVATVHDATLRTTDHIELSMYAGQDTAGTALFSNFVFTPLP